MQCNADYKHWIMKYVDGNMDGTIPEWTILIIVLEEILTEAKLKMPLKA